MENLSLYIEINVFCIIFLVILAVFVHRGVNREREQKLFSSLCVSAVFLLAWDVLWKFFDGTSFSFSRQLVMLLNALYFGQTGVLAYMWLRYALFVDDPSRAKERGLSYGLAVPMLLLVFLSFISIKTQWLFTVDGSNCYGRGMLLPLQFFIVSTYFILGMFFACWRARQRKNYVRRSKLASFAYMSVVPFLCWFFQLDNPGMPLVSCGITASLVVIFVENLNGMVSLDPLTRLNNKVQLNRFLEERMYSFNRNMQLVFFMFSVNDLKKINETYGSAEGDRALLLAAEAIKEEYGPKGFFIARFDSDKFSVVAELENIEDCVSLVSGLNRRVDDIAGGLGYKLSFSVGYGRFMDGDDIQGLVERAEKSLSVVKASRRSRE